MAAARKLTDDEVAAGLADLRGWRLAAGSLRRELRFRDFNEAFGFMARVALLAEQRDHHPDWSNVYDRVVIDLRSHDAGGITAKDFDLARAIDRLLETP
jgi:4a-hydroxytetrahydrobiopterin dehydratase